MSAKPVAACLGLAAFGPALVLGLSRPAPAKAPLPTVLLYPASPADVAATVDLRTRLRLDGVVQVLTYDSDSAVVRRAAAEAAHPEWLTGAPADEGARYSLARALGASFYIVVSPGRTPDGTHLELVDTTPAALAFDWYGTNRQYGARALESQVQAAAPRVSVGSLSGASSAPAADVYAPPERIAAAPLIVPSLSVPPVTAPRVAVPPVMPPLTAAAPPRPAPPAPVSVATPDQIASLTAPLAVVPPAPSLPAALPMPPARIGAAPAPVAPIAPPEQVAARPVPAAPLPAPSPVLAAPAPPLEVRAPALTPTIAPPERVAARPVPPAAAPAPRPSLTPPPQRVARVFLPPLPVTLAAPVVELPPPAPPASAPPPAPVPPIKAPAPKAEDLSAVLPLMAQGDSALDGGDLVGAISLYRQAVNGAPRAVAPRLKLARAYQKAGMSDKALDEAKRAVGIAPDDDALRQFLAQMDQDSGTSDGSLARLRALVDRDPDDASAHAGLAEGLWNGGDLRGAEAEYQAARKLAPADDHTADAHLAQLYAAQGRYEDASDALKSTGDGAYPLALKIVKGRSEALSSTLESSQAAFAQSKSTREQFYDAAKKASLDAQALAGFVARLKPPTAYRLSHLHRVLAANLLAQESAALVSSIETGSDKTTQTVALLEKSAQTEMLTAQAAEQSLGLWPRTVQDGRR